MVMVNVNVNVWVRCMGHGSCAFPRSWAVQRAADGMGTCLTMS